MFLLRGTCVICNTSNIAVVRLTDCSHCICKVRKPCVPVPCKYLIFNLHQEDISGYLESALGDISMFPIKCPLFYQGCKGCITANIAVTIPAWIFKVYVANSILICQKRFLSLSNYNRFLEFSDRAAFGDGMRCIFCNAFVVFPDNMSRISQVECPYCRDKFW